MSSALASPYQLESYTSSAGAAYMGWLAPSVLYMKASGELDSLIGLWIARTQERYLTQTRNVHYFADTTEVTRYAFSLRDESVRTLIRCRKNLGSLTLLATSTLVKTGALSAKLVLGDVVRVVSSRAEFERLLALATHR